jgi:hypothetical protein
LLYILEYLLLLCGCRCAKCGPIVDQDTLNASDIDQHIWLAVVTDIHESQSHHGLVSIWAGNRGGGQIRMGEKSEQLGSSLTLLIALLEQTPADRQEDSQ